MAEQWSSAGSKIWELQSYPLKLLIKDFLKLDLLINADLNTAVELQIAFCTNPNETGDESIKLDIKN